jgi:hypothetical protein
MFEWLRKCYSTRFDRMGTARFTGIVVVAANGTLFATNWAGGAEDLGTVPVFRAQIRRMM